MEFYIYGWGLTMITPLHCRVVVHIVQLLITDSQSQVNLMLGERLMCLSLLYSGGKC